MVSLVDATRNANARTSMSSVPRAPAAVWPERSREAPPDPADIAALRDAVLRRLTYSVGKNPISASE